MDLTHWLSQRELVVDDIVHNQSPARLYEMAIRQEQATIASSGALAFFSGDKTGRSPKDKRIVDHPESTRNIWWGSVNIKLDRNSFLINRQRAFDFIRTRPYVYVTDGYAGWDRQHRIKVRVVSTLAYHALFMHNLLIRPSDEELLDFGEPDFVIYNSGAFPANRFTSGMTSTASIDLDLEKRELVILGSLYAGEMKKGIFTFMNYRMPARGVLSMHCSANESQNGDVSLFFGLSGTGKTTLSADPRRRLIGDDEHCWSDHGIFNIEGGCYAKCANLDADREPEIFGAARFGAVLENVVIDAKTRIVDFADTSLTENTRVAYPLDFIPNAKATGIGGHPTNIIFLTCDAYGVLPPVSRLSAMQAIGHFLSGYTAKVQGTEVGVAEPEATFSACFGAAFLMWPPMKYAQLLGAKIRAHGVKCWLVNTGWIGGPYGVGERIRLVHTRAIIDAIHSGVLDNAAVERCSLFGFDVVTQCPGVVDNILVPAKSWNDPNDYARSAKQLAALFDENLRSCAHWQNGLSAAAV